MSAASTTDVDRTPVAKDIWCYSPKEKAFTWHVVMNHDAKGFVDRVQCKTTGQVHKYKRQNKAPAPRPSAPSTIRRNSLGELISVGKAPPVKAKVAATSATLEENWFKGIKAWGEKVVSTYEPTKFFDKSHVVEHPAFGKGVVQARRENKIDVLFRVGMKTLPSARKSE